jgi:hypothetical protein
MPADKSITAAWLRGGAGAMKDRRAPRGGARNEQADWMAEWDFEDEDASEPEEDGP